MNKLNQREWDQLFDSFIAQVDRIQHNREREAQKEAGDAQD